jgi:hypothetical protein
MTAMKYFVFPLIVSTNMEAGFSQEQAAKIIFGERFIFIFLGVMCIRGLIRNQSTRVQS